MSSPRFPPYLLLAAVLGAACSRRPEGPNILLITIDTTRRDHLGLYGYPIPTSPHLDRLAADSLVYTRAYAVSSWTLPTHASMFTGKFPSAHGANYDPEGPLKLSAGIEGGFDHYRARPIAEDERTLAALLDDYGYETGAVIAGPWMKRVFRLDKGFEHYDDDGVSALNGRPAADVTDAAIEFVDDHADDAFFLFLNYYDPHGPCFDAVKNAPWHDINPIYPPGVDPKTLDQGAWARIFYDAEIAYMDREIGRVIEHLKHSGLYENTWIFVLADHGELIDDHVLGDTGLWGHGDSLTEPEIHIPFFVKEPGPAGRKGTDAALVQQVDILPTILRRLGLAVPADVQGEPLGGGTHPTVAELVKLPMMNGADKDWRQLGDWRVLIEQDHKFGWGSNGQHFLVDLARDPAERTNLLSAQPELAVRLESSLTTLVNRWPKPGATGAVMQLDPDEMEALKKLGYTGDQDESQQDERENKDESK